MKLKCFCVTRQLLKMTEKLEVIDIEDGHVDDMTTAAETTTADCVSPMLTSMKLFGMYFRRRTDNSTSTKSPVQWNVIYPVVLVIIHWINLLRMFSMITKTLRRF